MTNSLLIDSMTIEVVDLPIEHGDFPWLSQSLPEGSIRTGGWTWED